MRYSLIVIASLVLFLSACDKCKDVKCTAAGECVNGVCECEVGWSGEKCQIEDDRCLTGTLICQNEGTCENSACTCAEWYIGDRCEIKRLDGWAGKYTGTKSCSGSSSEDVSVDLTSTADEPDQLQLGLSNGTCIMVFEDLNTFTIPEQTMKPDDYYTIVGSGSIEDGIWDLKVSFTITEPDGSVFQQCSFDSWTGFYESF